MIAKLKGHVEILGEGSVILSVGGVGYLVSCSRQTIAQLPAGQEASLLVETIIRPEQMTLVGFATADEQKCFRLLTTVQGVGTKVCLSILSAITPSQLVQAIAHQDSTILTQADGVGPKLATRIVTELKDKTGQLYAQTIHITDPTRVNVSLQSEETLSALVNLGYRKAEVLQTLNHLMSAGEDVTNFTTVLPKALKLLGPKA
jgi:Holliday junction DNA helicase RuvA